MNKAFEKILERLEEATYRIDDSATLSTRDVVNEEDAKEIVQQVAEEFATDTNVGNNGWIPAKTRPMTEEEKEYYTEYLFEGNGLIYECPLPDDGQEVLITSNYGSVDKTTFYTDCGNYFENYEDYNEVIAWQPLPQPYKESSYDRLQKM